MVGRGAGWLVVDDAFGRRLFPRGANRSRPESLQIDALAITLSMPRGSGRASRKFIFPAVYKGWSLRPHAPLLYEAERRDVANI